jgi:hypothetical protein
LQDNEIYSAFTNRIYQRLHLHTLSNLKQTRLQTRKVRHPTYTPDSISRRNPSSIASEPPQESSNQGNLCHNHSAFTKCQTQTEEKLTRRQWKKNLDVVETVEWERHPTETAQQIQTQGQASPGVNYCEGRLSRKENERLKQGFAFSRNANDKDQKLC